MAALQKAEESLAKLFKDLPPLPESSREGLAKVWPWLALIGGVLQLWAAWLLWDLINWADRATDIADTLSAYYTDFIIGPSGFEKTVMYLGIVLLLVNAVILLTAFPKLKLRLRAGWNLIFLVGLLNLVYGVLQIFTFQRGFGSFILSLLGSAIVFYLLFQVKEKFNK